MGIGLVPAFAFEVALGQELHYVDLRDTTPVSVGVAVFLPFERLRPLLRAYVLHQHEQGLISVIKNPLTTIVGLGDGIRHRAGVGTALGVQATLWRNDAIRVHFTPAATMSYFPDAHLGPSAYFGATFALGASFEIGLKGQ